MDNIDNIKETFHGMLEFPVHHPSFNGEGITEKSVGCGIWFLKFPLSCSH